MVKPMLRTEVQAKAMIRTDVKTKGGRGGCKSSIKKNEKPPTPPIPPTQVGENNYPSLCPVPSAYTIYLQFTYFYLLYLFFPKVDLINVFFLLLYVDGELRGVGSESRQAQQQAERPGE